MVVHVTNIRISVGADAVTSEHVPRHVSRSYKGPHMESICLMRRLGLCETHPPPAPRRQGGCYHRQNPQKQLSVPLAPHEHSPPGRLDNCLVRAKRESKYESATWPRGSFRCTVKEGKNSKTITRGFLM